MFSKRETKITELSLFTSVTQHDPFIIGNFNLHLHCFKLFCYPVMLPTTNDNVISLKMYTFVIKHNTKHNYPVGHLRQTSAVMGLQVTTNKKEIPKIYI